jgi:hypothetical protein
MIGLDTNVLARYYIADKADAEAARQHEAARRLIESGQPLMACKSMTGDSPAGSSGSDCCQGWWRQPDAPPEGPPLSAPVPSRTAWQPARPHARG